MRCARIDLQGRALDQFRRAVPRSRSVRSGRRRRGYLQQLLIPLKGVLKRVPLSKILSARFFFDYRLAEVLQGEFPIYQLVEHGADIIGLAILIIQVISMLPHVNGKQWLYACGQRDIGIGGLCCLEFIAIDNQPNPTTAKMGNGGGSKLLPTGVDAAERFLQFRFQCVLGIGESGKNMGQSCLHRLATVQTAWWVDGHRESS